MYDLQRIGKIISEIEKYMKELEEYKITRDNLKDSKNYYASSMLVFAILNRLIDLGSEIISAEQLGAPNAYQDIMNILAKGNIINKEMADKMNRLVSKKNIFAHFYGEVTEKEVFNTIQELKNIEGFLRAVKRRVKID